MKRHLALIGAVLLCGAIGTACANANFPTYGMGPSRFLRGNVEVVNIFVDTPRSSWTDDEIERYYNGLWQNISEIEGQARAYGASLSINASHLTASTHYNICDYGDPNFNIDWYWDIMEQWSVQSMQDLHDYWLGSNDDLAVLFLFDEEGRCYSYSSEEGLDWQEEFAVYFTRSIPDGKIDHELYHIFGAVDLYEPESTQKIGKRYFDESTMLGDDCRKLDNFNAFLVGWMEEMDQKTRDFLNEIK